MKMVSTVVVVGFVWALTASFQAQADAQGNYLDQEEAYGRYMMQRNFDEYMAQLTPRQRYLVQAVTAQGNAYYQQTGHVLPVTQVTLNKMMFIIRAYPSEKNFVWVV